MITEVGEPEEIWMFGSRAYRTGSTRSDIDLLLVDRKNEIRRNRLLEWRENDVTRRKVLDFFISRDGHMAESVINGSVLPHRADLPTELDAIPLWRNGSFESDGLWQHDVDADTDFKMTIIPTNFSRTLAELPGELARLRLPNTFMGSNWQSIAMYCSDVAVRAVASIAQLGRRAKCINTERAYPTDEYDVQNLLFLALKPWLPDLELSPMLIKYADQKKFADLAAVQSQLVIEVKFVKANDPSGNAQVVKQIAFLGNLYRQSASVKAVIILIVIEWDATGWDGSKIDHDHTDWNHSPVLLTRSISLPKPANGR